MILKTAYKILFVSNAEGTHGVNGPYVSFRLVKDTRITDA